MFTPRRRSSNAYDVKDSDTALESFNPVGKAQKAGSNFSAMVRTRSDVLPSVSQRQLQRKRTSEVDVGFALARDEHKKKNRRIDLTGLARALGNRSYKNDRILLNPEKRSKNDDFQKPFATKTLSEIYDYPLHNSIKGEIRPSFSKNPSGVPVVPPRNIITDLGGDREGYYDNGSGYVNHGAEADRPLEVGNLSTVRGARNRFPIMDGGPPVKAEAISPVQPSQIFNDPNYYEDYKQSSSGESDSGIIFPTEVDTLKKAIQAKSKPAQQRQQQPSKVLPQQQPIIGYKAPVAHETVKASSDAPENTKGSQKSKKRYQCNMPDCYKSFYQKTHLEIHTRAHTGVKPFLCKEPSCGQRFSQLGNLKTHERRHTGERPYNCDICGETFAQRGNVRAHKIIHQQTKPPTSIRQHFLSGTCETGAAGIFKETKPALCIKYTISEDMTKDERARNKARLSAIADRSRILGSKRSSVGFAHGRTGIEAHRNHATLPLKDRPGFFMPSRDDLQKKALSDNRDPASDMHSAYESIMMAGTFPASSLSASHYSSSYLEANFMKDFTCCGLTLDSLHDLLQHFEERHAHDIGNMLSHSDDANIMRRLEA